MFSVIGVHKYYSVQMIQLEESLKILNLVVVDGDRETVTKVALMEWRIWGRESV